MVEPLAANVVGKNIKVSLKKLKVEFLRIATPILGCSYDDLYRRHQRRLIRNIILSSAILFSFMASFSGYIYYQSVQITRKSNELKIAYEDAREKQLFQTVNYAKNLADQGDRTQAAAILEEAYTRFNKSADSYLEYKDRIQVAMAKAAFYSEYSPYIVMHQNGKILAAVFSEDDKYIASSSEDHTVAYWDATNGNQLLSIQHNDTASVLYIYKNYLIAGFPSGEICIWSSIDGTLIKSVYTYEQVDEESSADDGIEDNSLRKPYNAYGVKSIAYNETLKSFIILSTRDEDASFINVVSVPTNTATEPEIKLSKLFHNSLILSENGKYMVTYSKDKIIDFYPLDHLGLTSSEEQRLSNIEDHINITYVTVTNLTLDDEGNTIYINNYDTFDYSITVLNLCTKTQTAQFKYTNETPFQPEIVSNKIYDGNLIFNHSLFVVFAYDIDGELVSFGDEYRYDSNLSKVLSATSTVSYIPNSKNVIISDRSNNNFAYIFSVDGQKVAEIQLQALSPSVQAVNHIGNRILLGSYDGRIVLYSTESNDGTNKTILKETDITSGDGLSNKYSTV